MNIQKFDTSDGPHRIAFLLLPGFSLASLSAVLEPFRVANRLAGRPVFAPRFLSPDGQPVAASAGPAVIVDSALAEDGALVGDGARHPARGRAAPWRIVVVPAGDAVETGTAAARQAVYRWLRRAARDGAWLLAPANAPLLLARAGLLDGRTVTAHWEAAAALTEMHPAVRLRPDAWVHDGRILTASGAVAATGMALWLIGRMVDEPLARTVADQFNLPPTVAVAAGQARAPVSGARPDVAARLGMAHGALAAAVALMESHVEQPLAIAGIAARSGLSQRQLERLCRTTLGTTPKGHYLTIRLGRARELLAQTPLSLSEIAYATGFSGPAHFSASFRRRFGCPPSAMQRGFRRPAVDSQGGPDV
ncbi:MAG: helix-turn-helix domain-containing protein [Alphaproteobacteria bacterium]